MVAALVPRPVVRVAPGEIETAPMFLVVEAEPESVPAPVVVTTMPEEHFEAPPSVLAQIGLLEPRESPQQPTTAAPPSLDQPPTQTRRSHVFADAVHAAGRSLDRASEAVGGFRVRVIAGLSSLPPVTAQGAGEPSKAAGNAPTDKPGGGEPSAPPPSGNAGLALRGPVPARDNPPPVYPKDEARQGHQGTVLLHVVVSKDGRVVSTEVSRSSGFSALDSTAAETVRGWRFDPALDHDGHPQQCEADLPIYFTLKVPRGGR
ncbi:MAG: TonB family protein [Phycisphaerales bacterium]